jgi:acyl-CoA synthetase (AMP-forming)/AMP-acid ligase II
LRTGDLGIKKNGVLYITGRLKDIIIISGKNYAPHDIEQAAEQSHVAIQPNGCAAFGVDNTIGEAIVVVVEIRRTWIRRTAERQAIVKAIKKSVYSIFQLPVADVVPVRPYAIPRTSSGKLKRAQTRMDYLDRRLARLSDSGHADAIIENVQFQLKTVNTCN